MVACIHGGQAEAKSASSAKIFEQMAQTAAVADAESEKLRAAVPALAYLPADVDAFIALAHIHEHIHRAMKDGFLLDQPIGKTPPELAALESFALSLGDGSADGVRLLLPLLMDSSPWLQGWMNEAKPEIAQRVYDVVQQLEEQAQAAAAETFRQHWQMKPMYAVLTLKEGNDTMAQQCGNLVVSMILASHAESAEMVEHGDFRGVRIKNMPLGDGGARDVCVMSKTHGCTVVLALCAKPEEIALPTGPEASVLSAGCIKADDATLNDLLMVSYTGKDFVKVAQEYNRHNLSQSVDMACTVFEALAAVYPPQAAVYRKAVQGAETMLKLVLGEKPAAVNSESVLLCSLNKEKLVLEYSGDATGASYEPGVLRYVAQADARNNILYAESTPVADAGASADFAAFGAAALDVLRGYALTLQDEQKTQLNASLDTVDRLLPELKKLGSAFETVGSGLSRGGAFLIDADGALPALFGGTPKNRVAIPRFAYCSAVEKRDSLSAGWGQIFDAAGGIVGKLGGSPLLLKAIPFVSKKTGDAVSHCMYMPVFTEHMIPNVTVSDKAFVAGTSSAYNEKLISAGSGNLPYKGAVLAMHFEPLASMMRGIADAYRARIPAVEEAVPMSQFNAFGLAAPEPAEGKSTAVSELEEVAETLDEWAVAAEITASVAESCYTTLTTEQEKLILRTVVKLKK